MKILLMTPLWGQFGGKEQYILDCIDGLTRMGHECCLAYGRTSSRPGQTCLPSIRQHEIATYSEITSARDELGAEQLSGVLRTEAPDVVFMTDVRNLCLLTVLKNYGGLVPMSHDYQLACMRVSRTTYLRGWTCTHECGYACVLHGCCLQRNPLGKGIKYRSPFQHRAVLDFYKTLDIHLVASNYVKSRFIRDGFKQDQVRVVGYFTNTQSCSTVAVDGCVPTVTFVGRIDRLKGVDYLMHALAQLSSPYRCSVIGDGEYLPYCKELSKKLGIAGSVSFPGWLARRELAEHLSASSVVVVPSIWPEPFGIVGLEAMMCSKPVVAFDVGGISDWLRDGTNGYLVPLKRVDLLTQRIDALLRDRQKAAKMGAEGLRIVRTDFSKERHFAHLLSAFERAARMRREVQRKTCSCHFSGAAQEVNAVKDQFVRCGCAVAADTSKHLSPFQR
jgi:glycosyltransferase involved in cell wall biosynthesis